MFHEFQIILRPNEYWKYKFYGPNLKRDCGIEIKNASRWDNGIWTSSVEGAPSDGAFIYVKGTNPLYKTSSKKNIRKFMDINLRTQKVISL